MMRWIGAWLTLGVGTHLVGCALHHGLPGEGDADVRAFEGTLTATPPAEVLDTYTRADEWPLEAAVHVYVGPFAEHASALVLTSFARQTGVAPARRRGHDRWTLEGPLWLQPLAVTEGCGHRTDLYPMLRLSVSRRLVGAMGDVELHGEGSATIDVGNGLDASYYQGSATVSLVATADTRPPTVARLPRASPRHDPWSATLWIQGSEPLVEAEAVLRRTDERAPDVVLEADPRSGTLHTDAALPFGASYEVVLTPFRDLAGHEGRTPALRFDTVDDPGVATEPLDFEADAPSGFYTTSPASRVVRSDELPVPSGEGALLIRAGDQARVALPPTPGATRVLYRARGLLRAGEPERQSYPTVSVTDPTTRSGDVLAHATVGIGVAVGIDGGEYATALPTRDYVASLAGDVDPSAGLVVTFSAPSADGCGWFGGNDVLLDDVRIE